METKTSVSKATTTDLLARMQARVQAKREAEKKTLVKEGLDHILYERYPFLEAQAAIRAHA